MNALTSTGNVLNKMVFYYVLVFFTAINSYSKWCEETASTQGGLIFFILLPTILLGALGLLLPESIRRVLVIFSLLPFGYFGVRVAVAALSER